MSRQRPTEAARIKSPHDSAPGRESTRLTIALVTAALAMGYGAATVVSSLPDLGDALRIPVGQLNWVTSIQLLVTVVAVPVMGRLGDRHGHRRLLLVCLLSTAAGAAVMALATNFAVLLVGRALQGTIGGLFALGPALVRDRLPVAAGHTVIARFAGALLLGVFLGLGAGGSLGGFEDPLAAAFWISSGFFVVAAAVLLLAPESTTRLRTPLDLHGVGIFAVGLSGVALGIRSADTSGWTHPVTALLILAGLGVLAVWWQYSKTVPHPFIDVQSIANRRVLPPAAIALAFGVAQFGALTACVTFMSTSRDKYGYGLSMTTEDLAPLLAPCAILGLFAAIASAKVVARLGARVAFTASGSLLVVSFAALVVWHDTKLQFFVALMIYFAGNGAVQAMWPAVLSEAADPDSRGAITGIGQLLESLGGALSTAIFATILTSAAITGTDVPTLGAYQWVWGICAAVAFAMIPIAWFMSARQAKAIPAVIAGEHVAGAVQRTDR